MQEARGDVEAAHSIGAAAVAGGTERRIGTDNEGLFRTFGRDHRDAARKGEAVAVAGIPRGAAIVTAGERDDDVGVGDSIVGFLQRLVRLGLRAITRVVIAVDSIDVLQCSERSVDRCGGTIGRGQVKMVIAKARRHPGVVDDKGAQGAARLRGGCGEDKLRRPR